MIADHTMAYLDRLEVWRTMMPRPSLEPKTRNCSRRSIMNATRCSGLAAGILVAVAVVVPVSAQTTLRTVLAVAALPSVVDVPLHFTLLRASVPAGQATSYATSNGFVYQVSGMLRVSTDGNSAALRPGEATFAPVGKRATYTVTGNEPGVFLHFLLVPASEIGKVVAAEAASVSSLYHTAAPIPDLKPGPYEFTLTRVVIPARTPYNPPHYRSGAALYYIVSGAGARIVEGRTESWPTGSTVYEPYGLVHQWANPGDVPLVILQANISPEGTPVVIMGTSPASR
jgi:mannose-6-phosphate isomerase-like protein (cupin superfamily)